MNNKWIVTSDIANIKFPHSIVYDQIRYIYGIRSIKLHDSGLTKFIPICHTYDGTLKPIAVNNTLMSNDKSVLIWKVFKKDSHIVFFVEHKSIDSKTHSCTFHKYIVEPDNLFEFKMDQIKINEFPEKISKDYLIFNQIDGLYLASKLEPDESDPDYYWGKYLFEFYDETTNEIFKPANISDGKGQLIHFCTLINDCYNIVYSVRKQIKGRPREFTYTIYTAQTTDFRLFTEISEIKVNNDITDSIWYCYPDITDVILLNQDDFGKSKPTLVAIA